MRSPARRPAIGGDPTAALQNDQQIVDRSFAQRVGQHDIVADELVALRVHHDDVAEGANLAGLAVPDDLVGGDVIAVPLHPDRAESRSPGRPGCRTLPAPALNSTSSSASRRGRRAAVGGAGSFCRRRASGPRRLREQARAGARSTRLVVYAKIGPAAQPWFCTQPSLLHLGRRSTIRLATPSLCHCGGRVLKRLRTTDYFPGLPLMQIRFADTRPSGDFALVLPAAGKNRIALDSLGAEPRDGRCSAQPPAVRRGVRQRGRVVRSGRWRGSAPARRRHRATEPAPPMRPRSLAARSPARLLTSGETQAVLDLTGLNYDADAAARVALAAALRAWRYDRYRTKLKDKQKPTLKELDDRRRACGSGEPWEEALAAGLRRRLLHPRAGHRAGEHHLPGDLRRTRSGRGEGHRASKSRFWTARRCASSAWVRCSASLRARFAIRAC